MTKLERLGLGCMGMSNRRNPENSVKTIHAALDAGITLFNTGEFYNAGESELIERGIEKELIAAAKELGVKVLAFGTVGHGLFADNALDNIGNDLRLARGLLSPEHRDTNLPMLRAVKEIADEKGVALSQLAVAWSLAKYSCVQSLVGTANPDHLQSAVDALNITLTAEDIRRIEAAIPADKVSGKGSRNLRFTNGQMTLTKALKPESDFGEAKHIRLTPMGDNEPKAT